MARSPLARFSHRALQLLAPRRSAATVRLSSTIASPGSRPRVRHARDDSHPASVLTVAPSRPAIRHLSRSSPPPSSPNTASTPPESPVKLTHAGGDVYLHQLPSTSPSAPPPYAVSLLPTPPLYPTSPTVIGYLPPGPAPTVLNAQSGFEENDAFRELVHEVLKATCADDVWVQTVAKARGSEGYMHIIDERDPPPPNRTGDPDNILASLLADASGVPNPATYEPNASYRFVTRDGLMCLPKTLMEAVVRGCWVARSIEEEMVAKLEDGSPEGKMNPP